MNTSTSTTHHLNTLIAFRQEVYQNVFLQRQDALFNTLDALLSADTWSSFAYLSQSERFERQCPSLYDALQDGRGDTQALHQLLVRHLPQQEVGVPSCRRWLLRERTVWTP